jgi:kynurenine formamidase
MRLVDLSVEITDGFQSHASHARTTVMDFVTHAFSASRYLPPCRGFATKLLIMSDHGGTHADAPFHFIPEGATIEQVPLTSLVGSAVLLDVTEHTMRGQAATPAVLEAACRKSGVEMKPGDIAILHVWDQPWGAPGFHDAKGLDEFAAAWLVDRGVAAVGIDIAYLEADLSDLRRPVHMVVLGRGVPIVENLVNLDQIDRPRFTFIGLPLRIKGATGSPIRAVAVLDEPGEATWPVR